MRGKCSRSHCTCSVLAFHISANDPFHESEGAIISFLPRKFEGLVIDLGGPNTKSLFNKKKKTLNERHKMKLKITYRLRD